MFSLPGFLEQFIGEHTGPDAEDVLRRALLVLHSHIFGHVSITHFLTVPHQAALCNSISLIFTLADEQHFVYMCVGAALPADPGFTMMYIPRQFILISVQELIQVKICKAADMTWKHGQN